MAALHQRHLRLHLVQVVLQARHVGLQVADVLQLPHPRPLCALPVRDHPPVRLPPAPGTACGSARGLVMSICQSRTTRARRVYACSGCKHVSQHNKLRPQQAPSS